MHMFVHVYLLVLTLVGMVGLLMTYVAKPVLGLVLGKGAADNIVATAWPVVFGAALVWPLAPALFVWYVWRRQHARHLH